MTHSLNIDVNIDNLENNPQCFHGPTILFKKRSTHKEYYACASCRDRKFCNFYLPANDLAKNKQSDHCIEERKKAVKKIKYNVVRLLKTVDKHFRGFCVSCGVLFNTSKEDHSKCVTIKNITDFQLSHPSFICPPKENDKVEAQYLFSTDTTNTIVKFLRDLNIKRVVCMGTPRIHEELCESNQEIQSLLLDIDFKYHCFNSREQFIWFNMFNNCIFDKSQTTVLIKYLEYSEQMIVLLDPPFGGRVEPIKRTLNILNNEFKKKSSRGLDNYKNNKLIIP